MKQTPFPIYIKDAHRGIYFRLTSDSSADVLRMLRGTDGSYAISHHSSKMNTTFVAHLMDLGMSISNADEFADKLTELKRITNQIA